MNGHARWVTTVSISNLYILLSDLYCTSFHSDVTDDALNADGDVLALVDFLVYYGEEIELEIFHVKFIDIWYFS